MDTRCPRQLSSHPDSWCKLGVLRLKAIKEFQARLSRNPTEEEEALLSGCPWCINDQYSNFCYFCYISNENKEVNNNEVGHFLNISAIEVEAVLDKAIQKIHSHPDIINYKEIYGDDEKCRFDSPEDRDLYF